MTISDREKRLLYLLPVAFVMTGIYWYASEPPSGSTKVVAAVESVDRAEKRLVTLRQAAATVPARTSLLQSANAELAQREKGLIIADTASQAQAHLLEIIRRVTAAQQPPIQIRQVELAPPKPLGDAYGTVTVSITIDCRTDELVNLLAGFTQQPEAIATDDIRLGTAHPKQKNMPVRLTISGVVPRKLIPVEKKGTTLF